MPLETGDLIRWESRLWLVHKIDPTTATAFIESQDNERQILGTEAISEEGCKRISNPPHDWPAINLPPQRGRLVEVKRTGGYAEGVLAEPRLLGWLEDWVKMDDFQMGGTLFLNPQLGLRVGDRLVLTQRVSSGEFCHSIDIPREFRPVWEKRKVVAAVKEKAPSSLYDHVMDDDD